MNSLILLRRATADDVSAIRDLTRGAYAKWVAIIGREPVPMMADYDSAVRDHRIDLATIDGALVGLIETVPAADHLLIENIAVSPASQGRGVGRRLMEHAEAVADSLGLSSMRLYTNALMTENIHLYGRLGYQMDKEELKPDGRTVVYMSKTLNPSFGCQVAPQDHTPPE